MIEGLQKIDPEYEKRMLAFEIDCDNGKGDAWACHSVGEFLSVVKVSVRARDLERKVLSFSFCRSPCVIFFSGLMMI